MAILKVDSSGLVEPAAAEDYVARRRDEVAKRLQVLLGNDEVRNWFEALHAEVDGEYLGDESCKAQSMEAWQIAQATSCPVQRVSAMEEFILSFCGFHEIGAKYVVNGVHFQFSVDTQQLLSMQLSVPSAVEEPSAVEKAVFDEGQIARAKLALRVVVQTDNGLVANPFQFGKPAGFLHKLPLFAQLVMVLTTAVEAEWYQKEIPDCPIGINIYASLLTMDAPIEQMIGEAEVVEVLEMAKGASRGRGVVNAVRRIREKGAQVMLDDYDLKHPALDSSADGVKVSEMANAKHSLQALKSDGAPLLPMGAAEKAEFILQTQPNSSAHVVQTAAKILCATQPDLKILQQGGRALYDDEVFDKDALNVINRLGKDPEIVRAEDAWSLAWMGHEAIRRAKMCERKPVCGVTCSTDALDLSENTSKMTLRAQEATLVSVAQMLDSKKYSHICVAMMRLLLGLPNGAFVVMYDVNGGKKNGTQLPTRPITRLKDVFGTYARRFLKGDEICKCFAAIADASASAGHEGDFADKWSPLIVSTLAKNLADLTGQSLSSVEDKVSHLQNQPSDGALAVLSLNGTVVAANCRVLLHPQCELFRPDGSAVGMRHNTGLAVVEWLKANQLEGVVFIRSDAGPLMVMFADGDGHEIKAYQLPGLAEVASTVDDPRPVPVPTPNPVPVPKSVPNPVRAVAQTRQVPVPTPFPVEQVSGVVRTVRREFVRIVQHAVPVPPIQTHKREVPQVIRNPDPVSL